MGMHTTRATHAKMLTLFSQRKATRSHGTQKGSLGRSRDRAAAPRSRAASPVALVNATACGLTARANTRSAEGLCARQSVTHLARSEMAGWPAASSPGNSIPALASALERGASGSQTGESTCSASTVTAVASNLRRRLHAHGDHEHDARLGHLGTWGADCSRPRPRLAHKDGRPLKPRMGSGSAAFRRLTLQRPDLVRGEGDVLDSSTVRSPTRAPIRVGGEGASLNILCMRLTRGW